MDVISLHIPKTGGTSFYHILQQVYGPATSISYRRRDYHTTAQLPGGFEESIVSTTKVLHGHFYYPEVKPLHLRTGAKLVCWLRDPLERVHSNYRFFKYLLENPARNPQNYEANKHRTEETLLEYAALPECQNRMAAFTEGASIEDFFFIGFLERFSEDVSQLGKQLNWSNFTVPRKNVITAKKQSLSQQEQNLLMEWNEQDIRLYVKALRLRQLPVPAIYSAYRE